MLFVVRRLVVLWGFFGFVLFEVLGLVLFFLISAKFRSL